MTPEASTPSPPAAASSSSSSSSCHQNDSESLPSWYPRGFWGCTSACCCPCCGGNETSSSSTSSSRPSPSTKDLTRNNESEEEQEEQDGKPPKNLPPPWFQGNPEALAWCLENAGRNTAILGAGPFVGGALLSLAKEAAGCHENEDEDEDEDEECNGRVYGMRPSSFITTYIVVVGVLSASFMPLLGAVVDYMPHRRRRLGRICSSIFCIFMIPQIFLLGEGTWLGSAIIHTFVSFLGWVLAMLTMSYLPELTTDERKLNTFTAQSTMIQFSLVVVYLIVIIGLSTLMGWSDADEPDNVAAARSALALAFVVASTTMGLAWGYLFRSRSPLHNVVIPPPSQEGKQQKQQHQGDKQHNTNRDENHSYKDKKDDDDDDEGRIDHSQNDDDDDDDDNKKQDTTEDEEEGNEGNGERSGKCSTSSSSKEEGNEEGGEGEDAAMTADSYAPVKMSTASLWMAGARQLYRTAVRIRKNYRALKWFYIAVCFGNASTSSIPAILLSYLGDTMEFNSTEIGITTLITLMATIPGGFLAGKYVERLADPIGSAVLATLILLVTAILFGSVASRPGQQMRAYFLATGFGMGAGWKYTADKFMSSTLIPPRQNSELMGLFLFCGQSLSWIPPLLFTGLNEVDAISQRIALVVSIDVFFLPSIVSYLLIGKYSDALAAVGRNAPSPSSSST